MRRTVSQSRVFPKPLSRYLYCLQDQMCLMVADLLEFMPVSKDLRLAAGTGHRLRLAFSQSLGLYLGVYMHAPKRGQVWSHRLFRLREEESFP